MAHRCGFKQADPLAFASTLLCVVELRCVKRNEKEKQLRTCAADRSAILTSRIKRLSGCVGSVGQPRILHLLSRRPLGSEARGGAMLPRY